MIKAELTTHFNKRTKLDFPRNPDGTLILSDKVKKNQVKTKELLRGEDPTFPIDRMIFPKGKINKNKLSEQMGKPETTKAGGGGTQQSVHQLLKNTEELRKKATRDEEEGRNRSNAISVPAKGTKANSTRTTFK